ncbi:FAD-binding and (Fe-S)-binding domain-containing protein [Corynebacterium tapiri]|uniref:FAD-binding oxidoreductase n=1 Tax=Corynebacterium tapiri TaxID=1448266 RepID=A0A5C4U195_9CORY|nr:FAD-binding oxidoreductase [Corynebacterium tapiri]
MEARFRTDSTTRGAYTSDAGIFRRVPAAVFEPETNEDILEAVSYARENGIPVTVRGGGTSVAGNAIGEGLVIDVSTNFNKVLEVDPEAHTARIQSGVICDDLRDAVASYGLTYGPDPSTHSRCTVGGMIANNACGSHSVAWGTAAENVVELTVLRADGSLITLQRGGTSDPEVTEQLRQLRDEWIADFRLELGQFPRQVSGYGLHYLLDENGFDTAKAFAGSEGTLGIIVEAVVKLVPLPTHRALAVLAFPDIFSAAAAAPLTRRPGITTSEGMGGDLIDALRISQGPDAGSSLPGAEILPETGQRAAGGWLYCEAVGNSAEQARQRAEDLLAEFGKHPEHATVAAVVVEDPQEMRALWKIREASAGLVTRLPDGGEAWPSWEDSAVPPQNLADYLRDLYALLDKYELRGIPFGHFGEGCVHIRISFNFGTEEGMDVFRAFIKEASAIVAKHGGSLSGEHGDGRARSELLPVMYSERVLASFRRVKDIFDPNNLLNPGILVDPEPFDQGIRPAPGQRKHEFLPMHSLPRDKGSLVNAVNRCVGVGQCRTSTDAMCPSFQITGDEVHSTRGRARVLSEMFRGELYPEGTGSQEVKEALDLCLSCHACASECPVNVDMSTYKSEFLHQHHKQHRRPMAHYSMGWLPLTSNLLHRVPGLARVANAVLGVEPIKRLVMKLGGVEADRSMITFSPRSFQSEAKKRREASDGPTVVLWPDSFTNHLDAEVARDAFDVLTALGYRVVVPGGFVCCGLTWHSTGQLTVAKKVIEHTVKQMQPWIDGHTPIVVLEPSCASMLAKEGPQLLSESELAATMATQIKTLGEFVEAHASSADGEHTWPFAQIDGQALSQVHCHERSRRAHGGSASVLSRLGVDESTIQTGCCGLAGNWGFEPGHGEMSRQLGERELFPRVRELDDATPILADGFSCRTQIRDGLKDEPEHRHKRGIHLAQLLKSALRSSR